MANMFSQREKVRVPENIKECTETDQMTLNLWSWARRLETWGIVLCVLIILVGIIISTVEANQVKEVATSLYSSKNVTEFSFQIFFTEFIQYLFNGIVSYFVFHATALLIGALASIVQHTKISANVALMHEASSNASFSTESKSESLDIDDYSLVEKMGKGRMKDRCPACGKDDSKMILVKLKTYNDDTQEVFSVFLCEDCVSKIESKTPIDYRMYKSIRPWSTNWDDKNEEHSCAFCGNKTNCKRALAKNKNGNEELLWICDGCIKGFGASLQ